jgi:tetratricopeptide (TPR) repeat protein
MGELLICHEPIAALPYYVEGIGQNLYSMEELCYYIAKNTYLIDASFMNEELCTWVEKEMGLYRLAGQLRDIMREQGLLSDFVLAILESTSYATMKEMQEIILTIRQMEQKSDFECCKIRADQLMERRKYLAAIYEYKRLLDSEEAKAESALLCGNILHNLGTAYARLFLFEEAADCYDHAYRLNQAGESLRECLHCYLCLGDEERFLQKAEDHQLDEMGILEIKNELALAAKSQQEEMEGDPGEIIFAWKEEYRRSCRV